VATTPDNVERAIVGALGKHEMDPGNMPDVVTKAKLLEYIDSLSPRKMIAVGASWPGDRFERWCDVNGFATEKMVSGSGPSGYSRAFPREGDYDAGRTIRVMGGDLAGLYLVMGTETEKEDAESEANPVREEELDELEPEDPRAIVAEEAAKHGIAVDKALPLGDMVRAMCEAMARGAVTPRSVLVKSAESVSGQINGDDHAHGVEITVTQEDSAAGRISTVSGIGNGHVHTILIDLSKGTVGVSEEVDPMTGVAHSHPVEFKDDPP